MKALALLSVIALPVLGLGIIVAATNSAPEPLRRPRRRVRPTHRYDLADIFGF